MARAEAYIHTKWYLDPSSYLSTTDMGRKWGGGLLCPPFLRGSWVPVQQNVAQADVYLCTKWHLSPSSRLATTDMGREFGVPLLGRGAGSPSNTMCLKPTRMPSFILIHPTTNVSDRSDKQTDRQDRETDIERSDSIGRTVLQTVAQKTIVVRKIIVVTDGRHAVVAYAVQKCSVKYSCGGPKRKEVRCLRH